MGGCLSGSQSRDAHGEDAHDGHWSVVEPKSGDFEACFSAEEKIGEGMSAVVWRAYERTVQRRVAVKVFDRQRMTRRAISRMLSEVTVMNNLRHRNIVQLYDFWEDPLSFYVVMECLEGGELFYRIAAKSPYTEREARDLIRTLARAVLYMHTRGVVHRDLKPENLILRDASDDCSVCIADFGYSVRLEPGQTLHTKCGTPRYVAPEILKRQPYGKAVDIWSLGVIAFTLLCGHMPFPGYNQKVMYESIQKGRYQFQGDVWAAVSDEAKHLITRMLTVEPEGRITAKGILRHPWVITDDKLLLGRSLHASQRELKKFNARRKLRAGVQSIIAANKLQLVLAKLKVDADSIRPPEGATRGSKGDAIESSEAAVGAVERE